ncbi:MAG: ATP-binding cassette domain-containing protein [Thermoleophilia bacterium]|nr:ATP-binding cassette domain-containing protein [Thermoleophilia bacterium]
MPLEENTSQGIQALREFSLAIEAGASVGIIGESGAGKTTLAALATGLMKPDSGSIRVDGEELSAPGKTRLRNARIIQLIWQDTAGSVDPRIKAGDIIGEPLSIHGLSGKNEAHDNIAGLLSEVGLPGKLADRYPHELSGGELQRVVIARALAVSPRLLICDEPAASLDAHAKLQVSELLLRLRAERNLALMVIAHDLTLVRRITRELVVMKRGAIVEQGPTEKLTSTPSHPYSQLLIGSDVSGMQAPSPLHAQRSL